MNPVSLTWRLLTAEELTKVYLDEMRRDFPQSELKPLSMILNSEAAGTAHTWGIYDGDALAAYLLMVRPVGCAMSQLDYFAVLPRYRASGLGAALLAELPGHENGCQAILIEAECPEKAEDEAMAVRRLGFGCGLDGASLRRLVPGAGAALRPDHPGCGDHRAGAGRLLPPHDGRSAVEKTRHILPPGWGRSPVLTKACIQTVPPAPASCGGGRLFTKKRRLTERKNMGILGIGIICRVPAWAQINRRKKQ